MAGTRRVPISFGFQSRPGRYGQDGTNRIINVIPEEAGDEGKQKLQHYVIDGLRPVLTLPTGPVRAMFPAGGYLFVLAGLKIYRVSSNWGYVEVGVVDSADRAYMARNRRQTNPQIVLVTGGAAYVIESTTTFETTTVTKIADPDLPPPTSVTFVDGYFVYGIDDQVAGRFFISGLDEAGTISALDFATAETDPDRLVRVFRRKGELWLMGENTIEVWSNNGDALFPFIRLPGVAIDRGCKIGASVALLEEMVVWVADDGTVRAAKGYQGERISHHGVERSISKEPDKQSISAMTITKEGHSLYVLSGSTFTWVYDHTTQLWHERESYRKPRWRGETSVIWNDQTIVGNFETGDLYVSDPDYNKEGADPIVMLMRGPIQHDFPNHIQYFDIQLDVISGVGTESGTDDDVDPHAMVRYSDDGGKTWSSQRRGKLGKIGETDTKLKFSRLGQSSDKGRVVEFSISAGVARAMLGATAKVRRISAR